MMTENRSNRSVETSGPDEYIICNCKGGYIAI